MTGVTSPAENVISLPSLSLLLRAILFVLLPFTSGASEILKDIEYARANDSTLALDLYKPKKQTGPLIVYVHGGAWRSGSKKEMPLGDLVDSGYPVATIDYRLSTV